MSAVTARDQEAGCGSQEEKRKPPAWRVVGNGIETLASDQVYVLEICLQP